MREMWEFRARVCTLPLERQECFHSPEADFLWAMRGLGLRTCGCPGGGGTDGLLSGLVRGCADLLLWCGGVHSVAPEG